MAIWAIRGIQAQGKDALDASLMSLTCISLFGVGWLVLPFIFGVEEEWIGYK
jgi:hypothetical protein